MNFLNKLASNINRNKNRKLYFIPKYKKASFGDVIGVNRGLYSHFGIYINDNVVIHYASSTADISGTAHIHKTTLRKFLNGPNRYFVASFPSSYYFIGITTIQNLCKSCHKKNDWTDINNLLNRKSPFRLYSPVDTVRRALSRLGERNYSLISNNCEHFALWCKTGASMSTQVNSFFK